MNMLTEFKAFLLKTNALALAVAVVIGVAFGKVVSALVDGLVMPIVGMVTPGGEWRAIKVGPFLFGSVLGAIVDFVITAFVIFVVTKAFLREKPKPIAAPTTKECAQCCEQIPLAAKRCRACTSPV